MRREFIVLCDENGQSKGTAEKFTSHHAETPLHLAFSCYVFNKKGEFLVTQRALSKKVWPGVWTNSVCGHPAPGEDMLDAIKRRLKYEVGMTAKNFQLALPKYRYKTPPFNGIIENEFCPVYLAKATSAVHPNPEEVEDYKWLTWEEFVSEAARDGGDLWSWWCKDQVQQLQQQELVKAYITPKT